jgi:hypothetical protein
MQVQVRLAYAWHTDWQMGAFAVLQYAYRVLVHTAPKTDVEAPCLLRIWKKQKVAEIVALQVPAHSLGRSRSSLLLRLKAMEGRCG